jgi:TonB family protein
LQLADALTSLGDADLAAGIFAPAQSAFQEAVTLCERQDGENSEGLIAPLRGLGLSLARAGRAQSALPHFERALQIVRSAYGVLDLRQQDLLLDLSNSLTVLRREDDARDHMLHRVVIAEKTFGQGDPRVVPALTELGEWFTHTGQFREARIAQQVALNILDTRSSSDSLAAVQPLRAVAETHMREVSYPRIALLPQLPQGFTVDAWGAPVELDPQRLSTFGERSLEHALRILESDPTAPTAALVDTLLQMGDWFEIKHLPSKALPYYERAWRLLATDTAPVGAKGQLEFPQRVYYPTPLMVFRDPDAPASELDVHFVQVEFTVTREGAVKDARVVDHNTTKRFANSVLRAVRAARYRPKFADGKPVPTVAMSYREVFRVRKPNDATQAQATSRPLTRAM